MKLNKHTIKLRTRVAPEKLFPDSLPSLTFGKITVGGN